MLFDGLRVVSAFEPLKALSLSKGAERKGGKTFGYVIQLHAVAHAGNHAEVEQKVSKGRRAPESSDRLRFR
jgi:hypothetical protein